MAFGTQESKLDVKGRLFIPAYYREKLSVEETGKVVLVEGLDECLYILSWNSWQNTEAALKKIDRTNQVMRDLGRCLQKGKKECQVDKIGRIIIPRGLRQSVGLGKEVVLFDNTGTVEVWGKRKWQEYWKRVNERSMADMIEEIGKDLPDELKSKL